MPKAGREHRPKRFALLRVMMGCVVVMIVAHVAMHCAFQPRPKFDLMSDARCVVLSPGHLESAYVRDDACFSRLQVHKILTDLVLDASTVFDSYNLTYFLDSGTLLGSFRNGTLIPHDQDADFGMDVLSLDFLQTNPIAIPTKYTLHVFNSKVHPQGTRDKQLPARVVHKASGLYLDIFVYIDSYDRTTGERVTGPLPSSSFQCRFCPRVAPGIGHFQVPYDWIYPLKSCKFAHHSLKCPAQSDKYLHHVYGNFVRPVFDYINYQY